MRVLGIDLAWADGKPDKPANETGVIAVDEGGVVVEAGWTCGLDETVAWVDANSSSDTLAMVDAPLVVTNARGQRVCETHTGQRYGKWMVSANSTNLASRSLAGRDLRVRLERLGWIYDAGWQGPPTEGRRVSECYPYVTLVGAEELGYQEKRPVYKRKPRGMRITEFRVHRAAVCDDLVQRLEGLSRTDPRLTLRTHPVTSRLVDELSPAADRPYKHREDLVDAAICAWTGLLWLRRGPTRCQVLGERGPGLVATIIAPARPEQRP